MPISVDELSISIEAKAQSANTAIDRLVDKLDRLSGSLGRLNTTNLNTLAMGVNRLGTAMQTMNGVKTADFTRLAKNLERLNLIDVSNLSSISASVNHMATAFKGLENISQTAGQLGELANGIRQLGYKSADKAIENIPKLAVAMKDLMKTLSGAPKVSQNLIEMTNALAKLARTGASSGKAATSLSRSLNTYTKSTTKATSGTKGLASAIGKLYATYWLLFRAFGKLGDAIDISSKLTEVQNVVDVTFGKYADMVERMSDTSITDFGMSELTVKQVASRFQAMGTAMGFAQGQMADMSIELTKLTADMASFYNMSQEDVAKDLESVFTGMTRPLRTYGLDLTEATLKEWALRNGMNANIDAMSQMEKTMLRYQYVMANTGAAQGDFARTSNTWANQTRILKQNLEALASVIGGTLINALKPLVKALNAAMSHIIAFAETISNALGKIFGWTFEKSGGGIAQDFDDAAIGAEDIADSTGTAAKNIQKMKAGLRAFDELKTINLPETTDPNGGGGAGAGGAGDGAIAAGGQWVKVDSLFDKYKSEIDTLYKLGSYISKTLIDAMESIDWNAIYEKARGFGKGLADFLNGLFADQNGITLLGEVGKTIAKALNASIYAALSFGETFDFEQFGRNIADGINNFFQNFDFGALARNLNAWVQGIFSTVTTAISEIDWGAVWDGVKEFAENLDFETVAIIIGTLEIKKIKKLLMQNGLIKTIGALIGNMISSIPVVISKIPVVLSGIKILFNGGLLESTGFISKLANAIALTVGGAGTLHESLVATFGAIGTALAGIASTISGVVLAVTNFVKMLKDGFSWFNEILMVLGTALAAVGAVILGVSAPIAAVVAAVVAAVGTIVVLIHDKWDEIVSFLQSAISWFDQNVIEPVAGFFVGLATRIGQVFEGLWIIIQAVWIKASGWFNENVIVPLVNTFAPIVETISGFFTFLWESIQFLWGKAYEWFEENIITPVTSAFETACAKISEFFSGLWNGIKSGVASAMNAVIGAIESAINFLVGGINQIISGFNNVVSWAAEVVGTDWGGVDLVPTVSIPRISGYEIGGFPKPYSLFAAGEGGRAELLGTVGGQTAVAGGAEITGIRDAVWNAHNEEMKLMREQNELLRGILEKKFGITEQEIGKAAANYSRDYLGRTGRPAYSF